MRHRHDVTQGGGRAALTKLSIVTLLALSPVSVAAQTGPDRLVELYQNWVLTCSKPAEGAADAAGAPLNCVMEQTIKESGNGSILLRVVVQSGQASPVPIARLISPFGVDLAQGMVVSVDDAPPETLSFKSCFSYGCVAEMNLDELRLKDMRLGETLTAVIRPSDDPAKEMRLPVSLAGFSEALQRLLANAAAP